MNVQKLRDLLRGFAIELSQDTLRVSKNIGDDSSWREFTVSKYKSEEELAAFVKESFGKFE